MRVSIEADLMASPEELTAVLTAIASYLEAEQLALTAASAEDAEDWQWQATNALMTQGLIALRSPVRPGWSHVERLRLAGHGQPGIMGL
ncbi:MAG: hypothetical protein HC893_07045 [Chloroflexaceae bacterium]|nr:hypothetical protein [Chloroflexaceae bacterium]NJL33648.1 hypothetical protein [Chloroflexaceae bacterium]NJO04781.1 hypothetical protein [Chloroflexaceae bacterium]